VSLAFASALEQARLVAGKEVSPVELAELYLRRIDELDPKLDAYLTVAADFALSAARAAEARVGEDDLPPFHGVPISIKDLDDTAGIRTTHGTKSWSQRVPDRDASVVQRIKRAGFVILGKTNTPEFGKSVVSEPDGYPPARNPWDPERSPGGSSGGAAAALAAGLCALSHGNDGGGSIRMPAACCGVLGLKPSRGRISTAPGIPSPFGVHGALTRTVADAATVLDVLSGPEPGDMFWAPPPERPFADEVGCHPGRLRVAVSTRPAMDGATVDPVAVRSVEQGGELLASLGHDVEEADPDYGELPMMAHLALRAAGLVERGELPPAEELGDVVRMIHDLGRGLLAADYFAALRAVQDNNRRVVAFFEDHDVLLTPTLAVRPPLVGEVRNMLGDPLVQRIVQGMSAFTAIWNNTGQPALSMPFDVARDGLPVCVQLVGRPADESTLFRLAAQLEVARPWDRRPPIS
jgi:amidase